MPFLRRRHASVSPAAPVEPSPAAPIATPTAPMPAPPTLAEVLGGADASKDARARIELTVSAHGDTDDIPKVANAGEIVVDGDVEYQVMHNGIEVVRGGYFGDWMEEIIVRLRGHHEPQEERAFFEVLQRISGDAPVMIELGAYWAYYSLWFRQAFPGGRNFCFEPDVGSLELGQANAHRNGADIVFEQAAAGERSGDMARILSATVEGQTFDVPVRSVDDIVDAHDLDRVDLLHMDIQGAELGALRGAAATIAAGRIRFLFVSTHHHLISADALMHEKCLNLIREAGGHIVVEHSVAESFSGDGLIVASFDPADADFTVTTSYARARDALFRLPEDDIARLSAAYQQVLADLQAATGD